MRRRLSPQKLGKISQARLELCAQRTLDAGSLTFYPSMMCSLCLPREPMPGVRDYHHQVGESHLNIMVPSTGPTETTIDLPSGIYARGILWFIAQEVVRAKNGGDPNARTIKFGKNLTDAVLSITGKKQSSGGENSPREILERQLRNIGNSSFNYRRYTGGTREKTTQWQFTDTMETETLWKPQPVGEISSRCKEVTLQLNPMFYQDIIDHAVPIDERIMRALWPSCRQVDIYTWLTYRANHVCTLPDKFLPITWLDLIEQFGADRTIEDPVRPTRRDRANIKSFRQQFTDDFNLVKQVFDPVDPNCVRLSLAPNGKDLRGIFMEHPSVPGVTPRKGFKAFHMAGHARSQQQGFHPGYGQMSLLG